jgi:hypothetical protein
VRHGELAQSRFTRALFALRTLASGLRTNDGTTASIRIDDLKSSPARPGFQVLVDDPLCEVAVAAIGKVWRLAAKGRCGLGQKRQDTPLGENPQDHSRNSASNVGG